ncbi:hypothetical protein B0H03_12425 [Rathayibacter iranicus NCPPB 2253 = VKM Ac-1602]|uniref:Uncharacterized protein n=1 Tax=Rathayibacter iranicus NCPPB 2253 = VKM Ac-1602 TaxID=1328868 RepID=A0ABX5L836_9MICO|nr:hypothetical protein B0H03_12425 [Rathayibacter iranicus NCPPB 2253 = VKM Ac-1602]
MTCNLLYCTSERLVAFGVFESFSTVAPMDLTVAAG